jgi:hypothetical protein
MNEQLEYAEVETETMRATRAHQYGGPELMKLDELPSPEYGQGQASVTVERTEWQRSVATVK